ncbi:multi-copper oxidase laccase-like protein [Phakopsora pachyrhizi]|uniref:Multi-copper oxidase laccase-like protein n=1 Tax=Phakopsora pachyrhizi TaxID=170000 RepID=A0AAV0AVC2_PHAPC|nr:multi-copper oxidase laccase-like protein [Phakopsora pachyrhizi]
MAYGNPADMYLSPNFWITNVPQIRKFVLVASNRTSSFDGYVRNALVFNGQNPGPLIEFDTVEIMVKNEMSAPLTVHWHGIKQKGSVWMDGVGGITQCTIQPGTSFVYTFRAEGQFGTFWYHAHYENLLADGLLGPIVIHSPRDPLRRGIDFDNEMVLMFTDWYHDLSQNIADQLLTPEGYRGSIIPPSPDSAILNGVGFFDCEKFAEGKPCTTNRNPLEINVAPNQRTRIRLISTSSRLLFRISVDRHWLDVIEADATPVQSYQRFQRVPLHGGERYSVVIDTRKDKEGDSFYLRAAMITDCISPSLKTVEGSTGLAIIRVNRKFNVPLSKKTLPTSVDWNEALDGPCNDLDKNLLIPRIQGIEDSPPIGRIYYNTSFGTITIRDPVTSATKVLGRFFIDNTTWTSKYDDPLLPRFMNGGPGLIDKSEISMEVATRPGIWEIVYNNMDAAISHPMHLHGQDSCVVASGNGTMNDTLIGTVQYNAKNILCRDTFVVPGGGWIITRVIADNPGVWLLHCHLGWHFHQGFAGIFVSQPNVVSQTVLPMANQNLCRTIPYRNRNYRKRNTLAESKSTE